MTRPNFAKAGPPPEQRHFCRVLRLTPSKAAASSGGSHSAAKVELSRVMVASVTKPEARKGDQESFKPDNPCDKSVRSEP
jgi:hypothetical protein